MEIKRVDLVLAVEVAVEVMDLTRMTVERMMMMRLQ
jgi:hypothetical protein